MAARGRAPGGGIDERRTGTVATGPTVPSARGAVSLVTLFLLLVLAVAGYAAFLLIPPYLDNLDMREAVVASFNRMGADPDNGRIKLYLMSRANVIGTHWETPDGVPVEKRGLGLTDADIVIERDSASATEGRVQVDYQRDIRLWPTDTFKTLDFHVEKAGTLPR